MAERLRVFSCNGIGATAAVSAGEQELASAPCRSAHEEGAIEAPTLPVGNESRSGPPEPRPELKPQESDAGPPVSLARLVAGLDADMAASLEAERSQAGREQTFPRKTHVIFRLCGQPFAMPRPAVEALLRLPPYTRLPLVPDWLLGVCQLDDGLISVTDLGAFLGLTPLVQPLGNTALRVRCHAMISLMVVEKVDGLAHLEPRANPSGGFAVLNSAFLNGVADRDGSSIPILDPAAILQSRAFKWPASTALYPDAPGC